MTAPRRAGALAVAVALAALAVVAPAGAAGVDDPRRSQLWWFDTLGVETAWTTSRGEDVVVAVVDTGVQLDHPDLVGQFATAADGSTGRDLVDGGPVAGDPNGHGTLVAGLVAAIAGNGVGAAGVAPAARVLPVRVLGADGRGRASTVDAGIRWAVDNGADIINLSLEVEEVEGDAATLVAPNAAIDYAWERGVVVVAAAGNSGAGAAGYPPQAPVLLVGATDRDDALATFSDTGRTDAVVAPGTDMVATWCRATEDGCDPATPYGIGSGTSFAAPVVSGVLALLLATGLGPEQAVRVLRESAVDLGDPGPDERFGVGRVDAAAALALGAEVLAIEGPVAAPSPEPSPEPSPTPDSSPSATAQPSPGPEADEPVVDVPASPSPAPPADGRADAAGGPSAPAPALVIGVLALLLAVGTAAARGAFTPRGRPD